MAAHAVALVPLYGRDGLRGYALIDETNCDLVSGQAWALDGAGYARHHAIAEDGRSVALFLHQLILGLTPGTGRGEQGDHVNRNRLDNRRSNLRIVSGGANSQNLSGSLRGVSRRRSGHWQAQVGRKYLGVYATAEEAANAAEAYRRHEMPYSDEEHYQPFTPQIATAFRRSRKLTDEQVLAVRQYRGKDAEIATEFGISRTLVRNIRANVIYRDVKGAQ